MSNLIDGIFAAVMLMVFAICAIVGLMIFTSMDNATSGGFMFSGSFKQIYTALNSSAIFIAIAVSLAAVFSGLLIRTHPAFFFISLILIVIEFLLLPTFVNVYNGVASNMPVAVQNDMALQSQVFQMLPILTALGTALAVIVGIVRE
jgi:hypothetical protein